MFLPNDYEVPSSAGNYMKFEEGQNKFRVLSSAIVGYEYWIDEDGKRKPIRNKNLMAIPNEFKGEAKHFWAFAVWNYKYETVQILEVTQKGIMATINVLVNDEDWGDPKEYDIIVSRKGEGLDTEYSVVPVPPKKLDADTSRVKDINLEALFTGDDPFNMSGGNEDVDPEEVDIEDKSENPFA